MNRSSCNGKGGVLEEPGLLSYVCNDCSGTGEAKLGPKPVPVPEQIYLFVAYKEDSDDYCRGCHMASYSSDFRMENHQTRDEIIQLVANYLFRNTQTKINERGYEIHVFRDGFQIVADEQVTWDGHDRWGYDEDAYPPNIEELDVACHQDGHAIMKEASAIAARLREEKQQKDRQREESRLEHQRTTAAAARKQQYEVLKREFEPK